MHLYLAFLFHRDYFDRPDASLSCSFSPQGLFPPGQMHPYPAFLLHRDYFHPVRCISSFHFCTTGIISTSRIHLCLALLCHRDYFGQPDASLSCSFAPQGLFRPGQTRPPSLKASLPGHADQFRFMCPGTEREKGRMKNFRFSHVLFRSSEDHTSLSLASYIFAAICLATYTPLAEAWDSECVMPLPSPIIYRPS